MSERSAQIVTVLTPVEEDVLLVLVLEEGSTVEAVVMAVPVDGVGLPHPEAISTIRASRRVSVSAAKAVVHPCAWRPLLDMHIIPLDMDIIPSDMVGSTSAFAHGVDNSCIGARRHRLEGRERVLCIMMRSIDECYREKGTALVEITVRDEQGSVVVCVAQRLDASTTPEF